MIGALGRTDCGSVYTERYNSGTVVTLTAAASVSSTFSGCSGACAGTGGRMPTIAAAKSVVADFTLIYLPPGQETVAPPLSPNITSSFCDAPQFLYTAANPIQTGVFGDSMNCVRAMHTAASIANPTPR